LKNNETIDVIATFYAGKKTMGPFRIRQGRRWRDYDTMSGYVHKGKEFKYNDRGQ
jgi:hypothetical protein